MKIVFLAPFGLRPKGTVIARMVPLAAQLQNIGHEVIIIAPPYTNPEDSGRLEIVDGVVVKNCVLPGVGGIAMALLLSWRLFSAVLSEKPDLIHLFKPKGYAGIAVQFMMLLSRFGVALPPIFLDTDDWEGKGGMNASLDYSPLQKRVFEHQEEWLPIRAQGVTVASRALEQRINDMGVRPGKIHYIPNGVKSDYIDGNGGEARQRLGIAPDAPVVLLYTRFFEFDQEPLYVLFSELEKQISGIRFLIIGKGKSGEEDLLIEASRRLGFYEALVVAGWVDRADLGDFLAAGDMAIYPFRNDLVNRCKCPAKLTELLNAGIPVVAHRVGQIPEYILDGVAGGLLSAPEVWDEMTHQVVTLIKNRELRHSLGLAGRTRMQTCFSWQRAARTLDTFYRETLG